MYQIHKQAVLQLLATLIVIQKLLLEMRIRQALPAL